MWSVLVINLASISINEEGFQNLGSSLVKLKNLRHLQLQLPSPPLVEDDETLRHDRSLGVDELQCLQSLALTFTS